MKLRSIIFLCLLILIEEFSIIKLAAGQRNNNNNRRNKNSNKNKKKPAVGGKWKPTRVKVPKRRPAPAKDTKEEPNRQQSTNNQRRNQLFDDIVRPPLKRYEGEAPLQKPSWTHCLHGINVVDGNWASISSPNYPKPISGQLQCTWVFTGERGMRLRISFNDLDLQGMQGGRCGSQFVDVIDLSLLKSQGRFCGDEIPGDYVSEGNKIRVDLQGDTTLTPHKGFRAAVRMESLSMQAGLRRRSLMFDGPLTTTTIAPVRSVARTRTTTTTALKTSSSTADYFLTRSNSVNIYGPNRQLYINRQSEKDPDTEESSLNMIIMYVFIALFCLCVIVGGVAFAYRKPLGERYKKYKSKKSNQTSEKDTKDDKLKSHKKRLEDDDDISKDDREYFQDRQELPGVETPTFGGRRRRSVMFEDEVLAGMDSDSLPRNASNLSQRYHDEPTYNERDYGMFRTESSFKDLSHMNDGLNFQGWNYPNSEPIYEADTASLQSFSSTRSSNRHPDHETFKRKKILERNKALMTDQEIYVPHSEPNYHSHASAQPLFHIGAHTLSQYVTRQDYPFPPHMPPPYDAASNYLMGQSQSRQNTNFSQEQNMMHGYNPAGCDSGQGRDDLLYQSHNKELRFSPQQVEKPHEHIQDSLVEKQRQEATEMMQNLCGMKSSKSTSDLTSTGQYNSVEKLKSTQSMADLPVETNFLKRQVERRQSFSM